MRQLAAILLSFTALAAAAQSPAPGASGTGKAGAIAVAPPPISALRALVEAPSKVVVTRRRVFPAIPLAGGSLVVSGIGAFEPGREDERLLGVRLDVEHPSLADDDRLTYLDLHEVEELIRALDVLAVVAAEGGQGHTTEADFETIEGLRIGVSVANGNAVWWVRPKRSPDGPIAVAGTNLSGLARNLVAARDALFNH